MKKALLFAKRNFTEMTRDPLLYIFCVGFPVAMILMFQLIINYTNGETPVFYVKSLIPGVMMFSYSLLMLMSALLVSKDKTTSFLKRLFTSPLKPVEFIIGYFIPFFVIGLCQSIICVILGFIFGSVSGKGFCGVGSSLLLIVTMSPMMIINIMLGMLFGTLLNDKSAPAITSIFISASGVIGGAWMPVDAMGNFEKVCGFLPFYSSVCLGRMVTGATHTIPDNLGNEVLYSFSDNGVQSIIVIAIFLVVTTVLSIINFNKTMHSDLN